MTPAGSHRPAAADTSDAIADLADPATYANGLPHDTFERLRARSGLHWNPLPSTDSSAAEAQDGFWAVTRHTDVVNVSRDTTTFSSAVGHIQLYTIDDDALDARASMIDMDPPMHTRLRRLVSSAFTPRHVEGYLPAIRRRASSLLDQFVDDGGGDWVEAVAKPLPIGVICDLLGVPEADHAYMVELTDYLVEGTSARPLDPTAYGNTTDLRLLPFNSPAAHGINEYATALGNRRRTDPQDDLVSKLVHAEVDGERLTDAEVARFFQLMIFAGNETTRSTMAHLGLALSEHHQQFEALRHPNSHHPNERERSDAEPSIDGAVEEILRWASAIMYFRRTATTDTVLSGTTVKAGEKVVMWYASANFDEVIFDNPRQFDIARPILPAHVAFGGGGAHFCLGASLARIELRVLIEEFVGRGVQLVPDGSIARVRSNFVHGLEAAPFAIRPSIDAGSA